VNWSGLLKDQIRVRAEAWAQAGALPSYASRGSPPTVLFEPLANHSRHGNFHDAAWTAILATPNWRARLDKPHSQSSALPASKRAAAKELDSSNSSDALLMNCFCFPGAVGQILEGLGLPRQDDTPEFGFKAQLLLTDGTTDRTELDLKLGNLIFEAKLTESDFTSCSKSHLFHYRDFLSVFPADLLPSSGNDFEGYQLIRNVLAAAHHTASLFVLADQRRPDLLQEWWAVHAAIKEPGLRVRCGFRTWQQVAAASPSALAAFLYTKYGV